MRPWALLVGLLSFGCRAPTQITLELSTDIDCSQHQVNTQTSVGHIDDVDQKPPAATTPPPACQVGGRIGNLVVVPSGANDDVVAVDVVAGVDVDPSTSCRPAGAPLGGSSCIVARRSLRFIPHEDQTLPIVLSNKCIGIACPSGTTCVEGVCRDEGCNGPGCPTSGLGDAGVPDSGAPDAGPDVAGTDGGPDARTDAGACVGAQCQPVTLATVPGGATGGLSFIAVANATVFYSVLQSQPLVGMCPVSGATCTPMTLWKPSPVSQPNRLAVDTHNVYWGDYNSGVFSCPLMGCPGTVTAYASTSMVSALATDGAKLFWSSDSTRQLQACSVASCTPAPLAPWTGNAGSIATDGTSVYWTDNGGGVVLSCPYAGGRPIALATSGSPFGIAIDSTYVYWTDYLTAGGTVWRCGKDGSNPTMLASGQEGPHDLAVDATGLYWTNRGTMGAGNGAIMWCPASDCGGGPVALATGEGGPWGIALDATFVYWTNRDSGELRRVGKR